MTLALLISDAAAGWFDTGPIGMVVVVLAALLSLTALLALVVLRMLFLQREKLAEAEKKWQQQSAVMQAQWNAVPFPVLIKDASGIYQALNQACEARLGIGPSGMVGHSSLELPVQRWIPLADGSTAPQRLQQSSIDALRENKVQRCELDYLSSDGRQRTGLLLEAPTHAPDGSATGTIAMLLDITEYRQIERSARATEQSLRDITQRIPVVVFAVRRGDDRRQHLAFLAGNLRALFGLEHADLLEQDDVLRDWPFHDSIHPEDAPAVRRLLQRATRHRGTVTLDFRAYGAEGLRWIHLVMGTRQLSDHPLEWIGYVIDTTSINAHNQTLLAARDAAERASKAKADFLATMSHEIRTPMNGVIGMLELLGRTPLNQEQHELVHAVEDSAGVLLQVLNDVLDFSKLEAGNVRLDDAPFDLRTLIDNVAGMMTGSAHKKGLSVEVGADATLAGKLLGDSVRIRQVLMNLLNNAVKFTERGSVAVGLRVIGDDGHAQRIRISVTDTGIGIAADKQANLFTPFSQAESWTTRRYGGTGLGLAICRHLVQLMGGSVELSSRLGEGTKVTLELRLPVAQREVDRPAELAGRHAIVRLASIDTANALAAHLTTLGLTVEQIPPTQPMRRGAAANLLFIDHHDQQSATMIAAQPILVDASANGTSGSRDERLWLNTNPLKWQAVARVCAQTLKPSSALREMAAPVVAAPVDVPPATGRILVAEDHPISQSLIRRQLGLLGWDCDVVGDGHAALAALRQRDYAMLLTDCQMPLMNGYELATAWRQHEASTQHATHLPVIAMTANALDGEIERCFKAGMDDYLSKPVQLRPLEEKLRMWAPRTVAAPDTETALFDDVFAEPGMEDLRAEMLQAMLKTSGPDLAKLEQAIAQGDGAQAQRMLHRVLGALQLFTNGQVLAEGRALMATLDEGSAQAAWQQLPGYLQSLRLALSGLAEHSTRPSRLG